MPQDCAFYPWAPEDVWWDDVGACSRAPEGAMFVIGAKLCLATLLYAYAAGGSFLVLARKEPKKPL